VADGPIHCKGENLKSMAHGGAPTVICFRLEERDGTLPVEGLIKVRVQRVRLSPELDWGGNGERKSLCSA
jgi:hypothetical protein